MKVSLACRLLGHCRQAFYQSKVDIAKEAECERRVLASVRAIRTEDPRIGGYKLWLMLIGMYGREHVPGRDRFFVMLRRRGLMLPKPKPRLGIPPLTEERRKQLVKQSKGEAENAKMSVRNARREAIEGLKKAVKNDGMPEDCWYKMLESEGIPLMMKMKNT